MKQTLIFLRTFLFRFIGFTAVSLLMNWAWSDSETIGKTLITAFLTIVLYSVLEYFLPKIKNAN